MSRRDTLDPALTARFAWRLFSADEDVRSRAEALLAANTESRYRTKPEGVET